MIEFYKKIIKYGLIVFVIFITPVIIYILRDPYYDIPWNYNKPIKWVIHTIGDLSTKRLISSKNKKINCFIFGSSKSLTFYASQFKNKTKSISPDIKPYHYPNWGESIGGIYNKLIFLKKEGYTIKYAILMLDINLSFREKGLPHDFDHYKINQMNSIVYYFNHFNEFFNIKSAHFQENLKILLNKKTNNEYQFHCYFDSLYNEVRYTKNTTKTSKNTTVYISKLNHENLSEIFKKNGKNNYYKKIFSPFEINSIKKIKLFLKKNKVKYCIILNPVKNYYKLEETEQSFINSIFKNHLIDATGNIKLNYKNNIFVDKIHYHKKVNELIMDSVIRKWRDL